MPQFSKFGQFSKFQPDLKILTHVQIFKFILKFWPNSKILTQCNSFDIISKCWHKGNKSVEEMWGKIEYLSNRKTKMGFMFCIRSNFKVAIARIKINFTLFLTV